MRLLVVAIVSLLLLPVTAAAKSGIVLDSTPQGYTLGEPWAVSITAIRHDARVPIPRTAKPGIRIDKQNGDETQTFAARWQRDGTARARVVFPSSGVWTYSVIGIGRLGVNQGWEPVTILPAPAASSGVSASKVNEDGGGGFPLGWIAAASPIIIALGLLVERRRAGRSRAHIPASKRSQRGSCGGTRWRP
jgi:hypothetical protein